MDEKRTLTTEEKAEILGLMGIPRADECSVNAFISDEDGAEYSVWKVETGADRFVLKRAKGLEPEVYRCFFADKKPYVPELLASCEYGKDTYLLLEYCPGEDLRICSRERLIKVLDALIAMQSEFWERRDLYGCAANVERAMEGIENRGRYLGSALLEEAYARFVQVYLRTPRTLCHDDLLPINALIGERAVLIDWEYGGMLPYPVSFARLIAHGREEKSAYFYMTREDREFAIGYYYDKLIKDHGIPYGEYRDVLDLFLFYEYTEWVMLGNRYNGREDDRYRYYLKLAEDAAARILKINPL